MKYRISYLLALFWAVSSTAGDIDLIGNWYVSGFYEELVIQGNRAYVADVYGMATLDVADPGNINMLSHQAGQG